MTTFLTLLGIIMLLGGLWAFLQSPPGTQLPIPIVLAGLVLLIVLVFR